MDLNVYIGNEPGMLFVLEWWRDPAGGVISDGGRLTLNNGPQVVSLTITGVMASDSGNWSCTVSVASMGCVLPQQERSIMLTVVGGLQ